MDSQEQNLEVNTVTKKDYEDVFTLTCQTGGAVVTDDSWVKYN